MILRHLRDNVVAYLALVIALGGTSYAAGAIPNGSITAPKLANNAVTAGKIRDGNVGSRDVRDRSVRAVDLVVGVVPQDGFVFQRMVNGDNPVAAPDIGDVLPQSFTLPRAGTAHIRFFGARFSATCSAGTRNGGIYLDGAPLAGTRRPLAASGSEAALEMLASVPVAAGPHTLSFGIDCPTGDQQGGVVAGATWTVVLAAQ